MSSWAELKFGVTAPIALPELPPPKKLPKSCDRDHLYREFDLFAQAALPAVGGVYGHAVNRDLNIRLQKHFTDKSHLEIRFLMRQMVDAEIERRGLDIPPYVERHLSSLAGGGDTSAVIQRLEQQDKENQRQIRMTKTYAIKAQQGLQAGRLFYTACVPMSLVGELFSIDFKKLKPEERYQRNPSGARVGKLKDYLTENMDSYILPSLTASLDGEWEFVLDAPRSESGVLKLNPGVIVHLLDGSHRKEAIAQAIQFCDDLQDEHISVVFVGDRGLEQRRQWFSDINLTPVKPPKAMSLNYNSRDRVGNFNKEVINQIPLFKKYTVTDKGTPGGKGSNKLFVLTWLHDANKMMRSNASYDEDMQFCIAFWKALIDVIPAWKNYNPNKDDPSQVRELICSHAIAIKAFAKIGASLATVPKFREKPESIAAVLQPLAAIDWTKENPMWLGVVVEKADKSKYKMLSKNSDQLFNCLKKIVEKGGKKLQA